MKQLNLHSPYIQASICFALALVFTIAGEAVQALNLLPKSNLSAWLGGGAFLLFFSIANSIFLLASENSKKYFNQSMLAFTALAVLLVLTAWLISGVNIYGAGTYGWIYFVVTFGYLLFISIVRAMRKIMEIAKKEDDAIQRSMGNLPPEA